MALLCCTYKDTGKLTQYFCMEIMSLVHRFCDYCQYMKGYKAQTVKRYKNVMRLFTDNCNVQSIDEITDEHVKMFFLEGRTGRGWSTNTFVTYHKTFMVFFRWCVEQGHMQTNFAKDLKLPKIEKKLPPKLTRQEAMRLLEVVYNYPYKYKFLRYRNHAIFSMFILAGLRRGELLGLNLTDIDLENRSIFVRQGKGSKDRIVPMTLALVQSLERYLADRKRLNKTCPEFFTSLNRNKGFTEIGLRRLVVKMCDASGIAFYPHKLRHTFATLMLEGGCDIYSLSKMMGHADIKTTTIYLAASVEHLRSEIGKHPLG